MRKCFVANVDFWKDRPHGAHYRFCKDEADHVQQELSTVGAMFISGQDALKDFDFASIVACAGELLTLFPCKKGRTQGGGAH